MFPSASSIEVGKPLQSINRIKGSCSSRWVRGSGVSRNIVVIIGWVADAGGEVNMRCQLSCVKETVMCSPSNSFQETEAGCTLPKPKRTKASSRTRLCASCWGCWGRTKSELCFLEDLTLLNRNPEEDSNLLLSWSPHDHMALHRALTWILPE